MKQVNHYFRQVREAFMSAPDPDRIRASELRAARIELIQTIKAAEDHEIQAAAYRIQADALRERIEWLGCANCVVKGEQA